MHNLEIENIKRRIREDHPDIAQDGLRLECAAHEVLHDMGIHARTGMYCQGKPVEWRRDPWARTFVCAVCGETERDARHVFGSEEDPEEVVDWTRIEKLVNQNFATE